MSRFWQVLLLMLVLGAPVHAQPKPRLFSSTLGVYRVEFSPDGKLLAASGSGGVEVWDLASGKRLHALTDPSPLGWSLAFSPDSKLLAAPTSRMSVVLYDLAAGRVLAELTGHQSTVWTVAFSPDSKLLASGSEDQTVRLWDVAARKELRQCVGHTSGIWPLAFASEADVLVSGGSDGSVFVWDSQTGKKLRSWHTGAGSLWPLAVSPDGRVVATTPWTTGLVHLWETATGKERRQIHAGPGSAWHLAFAPDGRTLATAGHDQSVVVWEVATGKERARFEGLRQVASAVALSADGKWIAGAGGHAVIVWETAAAHRKDQPAAGQLTERELNERWEQLAGSDAVRAAEAIAVLAAVPAQTVPLFQERLKPARPHPAPDRQRLEKLVANLDADDFQTREDSSAELARLGKAAAPALREALNGNVSAEVRRRIDTLLARLGGAGVSPDVVRSLRALEVLEHISTPEARQLVDEVARTASEPLVVEEAKAVVRRLGRKG